MARAATARLSEILECPGCAITKLQDGSLGPSTKHYTYRTPCATLHCPVYAHACIALRMYVWKARGTFVKT